MTKTIEKKKARDILNEFITAVKDKVKFPKKVNWDEIYYSQFSDQVLHRSKCRKHSNR